VESFCCELESVFHSKAVPARINRIASLFTIFFTEREVKNFEDSVRADKKLYTQFYAQMREMGINLAPSPFECAMLSFAHSDQDFEKALEAARKVEFVAG
jgi:glutamate-1-semialdehyde 2,1-aminomutase (EC 5.4.3.8)